MNFSFAHAQSLTGVAFFPSVSLKQETGTLGGDQTALHSDFRLGYIGPSGIYVGFLYSQTSTVASIGLNQTSIGNSLGYFFGNVGLLTSLYFTSKSHESTSNNRVIRTEGAGYQVDLTYMFPAMGTVYLGPVLSYRVLTFGKEETLDGVIANRGRTESFIYPFFGLIYIF